MFLYFVALVLSIVIFSGASQDTDEQDRLLLALQKPNVTGSGSEYVMVAFNTGPNVIGEFWYSVACYEQNRNASLGPLTDNCGSIATGGLEPNGTVLGTLPRLYSRLDVNVTGLAGGYQYDCLVGVTTVGGRVTTCQFAGNASTPFNPQDWRLGSAGESCDDACGAEGLACNVNGMLGVTTAKQGVFVAYQLGIPEIDSFVGSAWGDAPGISGGSGTDQIQLKWNGETSTCTASWPGFSRFCCCGDSCPVST